MDQIYLTNNKLKMDLPRLNTAEKLQSDIKRLYISSYGFEERALGWLDYQEKNAQLINEALMFKYNPSKGTQNNPNRICEYIKALKNIGLNNNPQEIEYNWLQPQNIEDKIEDKIEKIINDFDEIIIDISSMTKFLILICLCKLTNYNGILRIIYSEAKNYCPTKEEYEKSKEDMAFLAKYPSQGVCAIARARCLSSIRMQGRPITLITFTSFNEQLVRHLLGTMNPHKLIFIHDKPPRKDFKWRAKATQEIHKKLIEQYPFDNPIDKKGDLINCVSNTNYIETVEKIHELYEKYGSYERIICGATGTKMQTVGLFFAKVMHSDIHIEYPTPDSYYVEGFSKGIGKINEIIIPKFSEFLLKLK